MAVPLCPSCGDHFSGFSFGSQPAVECRNCRKVKSERSLLAATPSATAPPSSVARVSPAALRRPNVTFALMGINFAVYAAMGLSGASWTAPSIHDAIRWGADFGPLTLDGGWWRLLTSMFVHFGIVHIAFNMWCFWDLGRALEPLMGRRAFLLTYLVSGIAASTVSEAWDPWRVSAGASGAIFGIAGAFASYLYFKKTPIDRAVVRQKLKSLGIFIAYNLFYGMRSGVDNSAHLGGLVAGLVLGAVIPAAILPGRQSKSGAIDSRSASSPSPLDTSSQSSEGARLMWVTAGSIAVLLVALARVHAMYLPVAQYGRAVKLASAGRFDQAVVAMSDAKSLGTHQVWADDLVGDWQLLRQNPAAAVPAFQQAVEAAPGAWDLRHNLALAYLGSGSVDQAAAEVSAALGHETDDRWRGLFIRSVAESQASPSENAIPDMQKVVQLRPDFYEGEDWLGYLYLRAGQNSEAERIYAAVLKVRPDDSQAVAGTRFLQGIPAGSAAPSAPGLPYSELLIKSDAWPLLP